MLPDSIVSAVLCRFDSAYQPWQQQPTASAHGFSGAQVLRVVSDRGPFCLRAWPKESLPRKRILGLHRLLSQIHQSGVSQVAVPIAALNGATLVRVERTDWQLEPWMPGQADFHCQPTQERLRAAMACLADWHNAAAQFVAHQGEAAWFASHPNAPSPAVGERLELIGRWSGSRRLNLTRRMQSGPMGEFNQLGVRILALYDELQPRIEVLLRSAVGIPFRLQPCLRDVWHDHVLFAGETVSGLIDPNACRSENVAADLARLLGSLVGDDPQAWSLAIEHYCRFRELSAAERHLVKVLDQSATLLSGMTWLDRVYFRNWPIVDMPSVCERLKTIISRMETLAGQGTRFAPDGM